MAWEVINFFSPRYESECLPSSFPLSLLHVFAVASPKKRRKKGAKERTICLSHNFPKQEVRDGPVRDRKVGLHIDWLTGEISYALGRRLGQPRPVLVMHLSVQVATTKHRIRNHLFFTQGRAQVVRVGGEGARVRGYEVLL